MRQLQILLVGFLTAFLLVACDNEEESLAKPTPQEPNREAIGYYCNMIVVDHLGPKAQIFLKGSDQPLWFTSVRDAIAFTMMPDEPKSIVSLYVSDMARATWDKPEPGIWIEADSATYVIGSARRGGMGAQEVVPFSKAEAAERFIAEHGGRIVNFSAIPESYVLSAEPEMQHHQMQDGRHEEGEGHDHAN